MVARIFFAVALATLLILSSAQTDSTEGLTTIVVDATTGSDVTTSTVEPTTVLPPAEEGKWNVSSADTKEVCILLTMAATFNINYTDTANKTRTATVNLPTDATARGSCNETTGQWIELTFLTNWKLTWMFEENKTTTGVKELIFEYTTGNSVFVDIRTADADKNVTVQTNDTGKIGSVNNNNSYLCKSLQTINITSDVSMDASDLQMQSYRKTDTGVFGTAQQCPADTDTSNIVPIVVGAALAALVVIVLIAYLISRNRNKTGYESV